MADEMNKQFVCLFIMCNAICHNKLTEPKSHFIKFVNEMDYKLIMSMNPFWVYEIKDSKCLG